MTATTITFLGGARTVTGSRFLVEHQGRRVLVDAGLFQGLKELRLRNWAPFGVPPGDLDAVVLTHAHLDHCGYLPRLVTGGYHGDVWCTDGTADLAAIVLPDSGRLQEEEADFANRVGYSKHRPALPLYTEQEAVSTLGALHPAPFAHPVEVAPGTTATLRPAGHILGSATVTLALDGGPTIVFSGDLGRPQHPLLVPPAPVGDADWVVVESTYGDRVHDDAHLADTLAAVIERTVARGGVVIIPAFAVDRTEVLLHHLGRLARAGRLPDVPVYVDSPMALAALGVYRTAVAGGAPDVRPEVAAGPDPFAASHLVAVPDVEGSKRLTASTEPAVIVSASGMATGGRVVHHLVAKLPDPRTTVLFPGFQAEGTRGRTLVEGAREVKMLGQYVRVRAEVVHLPAFSVHADAPELLAWLRTASPQLRGVFVVHGEERAARQLAGRIDADLDVLAAVPAPGERVRLEGRPAHGGRGARRG